MQVVSINLCTSDNSSISGRPGAGKDKEKVANTSCSRWPAATLHIFAATFSDKNSASFKSILTCEPSKKSCPFVAGRLLTDDAVVSVHVMDSTVLAELSSSISISVGEIISCYQAGKKLIFLGVVK
jgi:hypothetical protein